MTNVVPVHQARRHLGELIQKAHYGGMPFVLTHHDKPMATLIGTKEFIEMMELIEKHDPGLADTLAILSNPETQSQLEQSRRDSAAGRTVPIDKLVDND